MVDFNEIIALSDEALLFIGLVLAVVFNQWLYGGVAVALGLLLMYAFGELSFDDIFGRRKTDDDAPM